MPSACRSFRRFVSNSANTPSMSRNAFPAALVVSMGCSLAPCRSPGALRSTPINGHLQTGPVGPVRAKTSHCMLAQSRAWPRCVAYDGQGRAYFVSRSLVIRSVTMMPSLLQSQAIEPPSGIVMPRLRSLLPYPPSPAGVATGGPPRSVQTTTTSVS